MVSKVITVKNSIGMHDKVTPFLIQKANSFSCSVWIESGVRRVNAKSLLGILSLVLSDGMSVNVLADGEDENQAIETICKLISEGIVSD